MRQTITAKPKLVQISTAYGRPKADSATVPRNKYVEIRSDKPPTKKQRDWPEYKTCKFTTEAIVTEGSEKGETQACLRESRMPDSPRPQAEAGRDRRGHQSGTGEAPPRGGHRPGDGLARLEAPSAKRSPFA